MNIIKQINAIAKEDVINNVIEEVLEGNINPLELEMKLRALEDISKKIRADIRIKNAVYDEAMKHDGQQYNGYEVSVTSRKTADYASDDEWILLKAKVKAREVFLKSLKEPTIDKDTGEMVQPARYRVSDVVRIIKAK
jgi:hypothetical protein